MTTASPLITAEALVEQIGDPSLGIIDATWFAPFLPNDVEALAAFAQEHIPGSVFLDIDQVAETGTGFSHTVPSQNTFIEQTAELGLGKHSRFIVYDRNRFYASARVWWLLRLMGLDDVLVLDGGLEAWRAAGGPTHSGTHKVERSSLRDSVAYDPGLLSKTIELELQLDTHSHQIVDARPSGRFDGTSPEPRAGLESGHIPGSVNLQASDLISANGKLKSVADLSDVFSNARIDFRKPVIASCGSGVAAAVILLAAAQLGHWRVSLYDGSWTEWASDPTRPIATRNGERA